MASLEELRAVRLSKLELLKKSGMEAYPSKVPRTFCLADSRKNFSDYEEGKGGAHAGESVSIVGRIMAIRGQGAIQFFVLDDGKSTFQAVIKKDVLSPESFDLLSAAVDIGDIVSITGTFFTTNRGEQSILAKSWTMASKALLPLPEKWHGLQDPDEKLRKRYLDLIMDPESRELFKKKAKFWEVIRSFMKEEGFMEVETPTLELTTGGAEATPFKTHHNDFDLDVYLRISIGELWQKRLIAGGFQKIYEIGRAYRNEGTSPEHLQEFTNLEFYWAYANYEDGMEMVQKMYRKIATEVFGTTTFTYKDHTFNLADEWKKVDYREEILRQTKIDISTATDKEIRAKLIELAVEFDGDNRERLIDTLWKYCRKNITGPVFLINHPVLVAPLAKALAEDTSRVQMFQPIIAGSEIGRGYSELNDPIDQKARFEAQQKLLEMGDTEAMMMDEEFVEMLEHAMPPTCGYGFGERLFAFLANKPLRETQFFPLMKPKKE